MASETPAYKSKIRVIGKDPYEIPLNEQKSVLDLERDELPDFSYADIYNYLINKAGYDGAKLKAYKSLEGYRFFQSGWVRSLVVPTSNSYFCILWQGEILL